MAFRTVRKFFVNSPSTSAMMTKVSIGTTVRTVLRSRFYLDGCLSDGGILSFNAFSFTLIFLYSVSNEIFQEVINKEKIIHLILKEKKAILYNASSEKIVYPGLLFLLKSMSFYVN